MGWFKQLCLSWIILSAAAVSGSCQELTSTLREGNRTCRGEEVIFTCTIRGSSTLSVLAVAWSSIEYIGQDGSLQLSTEDMLGEVETSTSMDGSITATATVTNKTNINGELILESTLRITAVETSTVTCRDPNIGPVSIEFTVSAVPGVPQSISAAEISRPTDNICIILVQWDPPTNSDASDIGQYNIIVYVPSRNIKMTVSSSSTISTLTVSNCGDDIRVQVAAVNRIGCVGMNSSEVQLVLLDIPTATTENGSATIGVGSTPISSQLGAGAISGIAIGSTIGFCFAVLVIAAFPCGCLLRSLWRHNPNKEIMPGGEIHELLPKVEEGVDYVWDLQKRASLQAKECYQKQSKHGIDELGTEEDQVSVPIWIDDELDYNWKASLREAVKAINEAAPGLLLSITEDKEQAIINVVAIQEYEPDKKEPHTKGNILLRLTTGQADYITTIYLGKSEDDAKKGISTRELFHALGFQEDNNFGLTRFDPTSITLYQSEEAYESARRKHPGDLVWWLKTVNDPKLSELDKVYLNLIHRPCRGARYTPKIGKTGMYYCGRSVMSNHTYPGDKYIDGICGPSNGPNCPACRTIRSEKVDEILKKQKWQGMTGRVYCGRLFTEPTKRHNGVCGMNNGPACPDCVDLLN